MTKKKNVSKRHKKPTQQTSIGEVKYARKKELLQYYGINYIKLKFSYTWQKEKMGLEMPLWV